MTELPSGPKSSEAKRHDFEANLQSYVEGLGLPNNDTMLNQVKADAGRFMELSFGGKRQMTSEECYEATAVLQQYASCIHREAQRQEAIAAWSSEQVSKTIVENLKAQSAYGTKERWICAVAENDAAVRLDQFRIRAESYAKSLAYLPMRIEKIAESYARLGDAKRKQERNYS